jgi:two-component system, NtrC family, nitrogen regulation sensor histidine kinase GlnL
MTRPIFVSLRTKLLIGTILIVAVLMVAVTAVVEHRQRTTIIEEVHRRGTALAEGLAGVSAGALLLYNFTALEQNVVRFDQETDVAYALILDRTGQVVAHSRAPGAVGSTPTDPVSQRALGAAPVLQETVGPGGEALYDVAVPIVVEGARWGTVRIALSRRRMDAEIAGTRWELLALALVALMLGGVATAIVARRITRPVAQLADGVSAIARGELDQRIDPGRSDELGRLALAFNEMAAQLRQQRRDLEVADATLRQRFAELSDLKSYTDHILRSLMNGLVTLDLDGRVVTVNPAAELLTGCAASTLTGRPATDAFHHLPELRDLLLETLRTRVGVPQASLMLARTDGQSVPVEVTTTPLRGAEGQALGVVAMLRDLTPVRQLEEQLRRSDRLAALGTLAAGLAHEIKNPLTSIMTFSRHVTRRFDDERFRQRFQSVVPRELERINAIVDGLLRLARPARLVLAPVHLPPLLDQALELYAHQIESRRIRVRREWAVGVPPVPGDAEHLYQAFLNLIGNAIDAMDEGGGTLTVRLGWPQNAEGLGGALPDRLVVEVRDTGSGIKPEETPDVFNPFFTTKAGGTGLGLAIAHKIIEDHGGTVTFHSTPGQETVFAVTLPLRTGRRADRPTSEEWRVGRQAT